MKKIRAATRQDKEELREIILLAVEDLADLYTGTSNPEERNKILDDFICQETNRFSYRNCLVYEEDGTVLGGILCYAVQDLTILDQPILSFLNSKGSNLSALPKECEGEEYYIDSVSVFEAARGKGVGSKLIEAAADKAMQEGYGTISLIVDKNKPSAKNLYEKLGFKPKGTIHLGKHQYDKMVKPLK